MKTKLFLVLGIIGLAAATTAPKAHAGGLSIDISFGIPVRYHPPVVVMASPICRPVIYAPPVYHHHHHDHWNHGRGHHH